MRLRIGACQYCGSDLYSIVEWPPVADWPVDDRPNVTGHDDACRCRATGLYSVEAANILDHRALLMALESILTGETS